MPTSVQLTPPTLQVPVVNPGQGSQPQPIALTLTGSPAEPLLVSLAITDAPAGVFLGELVQETMTVDGRVKRTLAATTPGLGYPLSYTLSPSEAGTEPYSIQIQCTAPTQPVPDEFQGNLTVSWLNGSASVALVGTTAQLQATVATGQPIPLKAGGTTTVPITVAYASSDATVLRADLGPAAFPAPTPTGLTIGTGSASLPPVFVEVPIGNPKPFQPGSGLIRVLESNRTATVSLTASAAKSLQPGAQVAYVGVDAPDFPQLDPTPVKVTFNIQPLPVQVSIVGAQPVTVIAGEPITVTLSATTAGAPTMLSLGTPVSMVPGISVGLPASDWVDRQTGIGGATGAAITAPLKISADPTYFRGPSTVTESMISIPWSAYGGLVTGSVPLQIRVLANMVAFQTGPLGGTGTTASATWVLFANGNWEFIGNISNSYIFAADYNYGIVLNVGNPPLAVVNYSTVGPDLLAFSNTDSWDAHGNNPVITELWPQIVMAHARAVLNVSTNVADAVFESLGIAVVAVLAAAGGAWVYKNCTYGGIGVQPDDKGGFAVVVWLNCNPPGQ